jgi:hypothetical protein
MAQVNSYEEWTRSEIVRLKAEADKALAEAATLQRAFDKWLESQGRKSELQKSVETPKTNDHAPVRRGRRLGYGNKNASALEMIKAATQTGGLTTDQIYDAFIEMYGAKYKRSSLRALLFHQKGLGNIERVADRYVIAQKATA